MDKLKELKTGDLIIDHTIGGQRRTFVISKDLPLREIIEGDVVVVPEPSRHADVLKIADGVFVEMWHGHH